MFAIFEIRNFFYAALILLLLSTWFLIKILIDRIDERRSWRLTELKLSYIRQLILFFITSYTRRYLLRFYTLKVKFLHAIPLCYVMSRRSFFFYFFFGIFPHVCFSNLVIPLPFYLIYPFLFHSLTNRFFFIFISNSKLFHTEVI